MDQTPPLTKVVVDRTKWIRGVGGKRSFLVVPTEGASNRGQPLEDIGKMCCVGFACLAKGIGFDRIVGVKTISVETLVPTYKGVEGAAIMSNLYNWNDEEYEQDIVREGRIKAEGLKIGLEFEFVN